jgi:hypothetical protein
MIPARLSTVAQNFRAQGCFPSAAPVRFPLAMEIADLIGACEVGQFRQRCAQNCFVARSFVRRSECAPHRVIDENSARRCDFGHDIEGGADDECGNALCFDDVGNETDGLVAKGSVRHEQGKIHHHIF